jgi:hypothetical protein
MQSMAFITFAKCSLMSMSEEIGDKRSHEPRGPNASAVVDFADKPRIHGTRSDHYCTANPQTANPQTTVTRNLALSYMTNC